MRFNIFWEQHMHISWRNSSMVTSMSIHIQRYHNFWLIRKLLKMLARYSFWNIAINTSSHNSHCVWCFRQIFWYKRMFVLVVFIRWRELNLTGSLNGILTRTVIYKRIVICIFCCILSGWWLFLLQFPFLNFFAFPTITLIIYNKK